MPPVVLSSDLIDEWDAFLTTPSASDPPPPALQPTSSSSSGEFNVFTFVGSTVASGGVGGSASNKRAFLLDNADAFCFCNIGGMKICIRACTDGKSCGIPTHGHRKAKII